MIYFTRIEKAFRNVNRKGARVAQSLKRLTLGFRSGLISGS